MHFFRKSLEFHCCHAPYSSLPWSHCLSWHFTSLVSVCKLMLCQTFYNPTVGKRLYRHEGWCVLWNHCISWTESLVEKRHCISRKTINRTQIWTWSPHIKKKIIDTHYLKGWLAPITPQLISLWLGFLIFISVMRKFRGCLFDIEGSALSLGKVCLLTGF